MEKKKEKRIYYSQSALKIFEKDPELYKEIYLNDKKNSLGMKTSKKNNEKIKNGIDFHILAERYFNGMKDYFYIEDEKILNWLKVLEDEYPILGEEKLKVEYEIKQNKDNLKLIAKYDLLILKENELKIVDLKTNEKIYNYENIENYIQTKVYMYILGESLERIAPNLKKEQIKMEYFQLNYPKNKLKIDYNEKKHQKNKVFLEELINKIKNIQKN